MARWVAGRCLAKLVPAARRGQPADSAAPGHLPACLQPQGHLEQRAGAGQLQLLPPRQVLQHPGLQGLQDLRRRHLLDRPGVCLHRLPRGLRSSSGQLVVHAMVRAALPAGLRCWPRVCRLPASLPSRPPLHPGSQPPSPPPPPPMPVPLVQQAGHVCSRPQVAHLQAVPPGLPVPH